MPITAIPSTALESASVMRSPPALVRMSDTSVPALSRLSSAMSLNDSGSPALRTGALLVGGIGPGAAAVS